jgi:hypothetical protein
MSTQRKMMAADAKLANKIVELAKRRESTVFKTVNDILEEALRADQMGLSLNEIIDEREVLEKAKKMGFTFIFKKLLYDVIDYAYLQNKKGISEMWLDTGRWYGKYFSNRSDDGIDTFSEAMNLMTIGDSIFKIEKTPGNGIRVSCVGANFTSGFTEVYSLFIEGVCETFGMKLEEKENSKGIIRLGFKKSR